MTYSFDSKAFDYNYSAEIFAPKYAFKTSKTDPKVNLALIIIIQSGYDFMFFQLVNKSLIFINNNMISLVYLLSQNQKEIYFIIKLINKISTTHHLITVCGYSFVYIATVLQYIK
jgi:hypothetical protein